MKRLLSLAVLVLSLTPSITFADEAAKSWDITKTVATALTLPAQRVTYTFKSRNAKIYVDYNDMLTVLYPYRTERYRDRELLARIQIRMKVFGPEIDMGLIPEAKPTEEHMLELFAPLFAAGKVSILDRSTGNLVSAFTIHDHGVSQGSTILEGSMDYILPSGTVFYSLPYGNYYGY